METDWPALGFQSVPKAAGEQFRQIVGTQIASAKVDEVAFGSSGALEDGRRMTR